MDFVQTSSNTGAGALMLSEWKSASRGRGQGWKLLIRAARDSSIVQGGSAALAGQDRRAEVSAPNGVHTAAYQLRYCCRDTGRRNDSVCVSEIALRGSRRPQERRKI